MSDQIEKKTTSRITRRRFLGAVAGSAAALATAPILKTSAKESPITKNFYINRAQTATVEFWFGEPPENGPQDLADAFMKLHPDIKVNTTRFVNDDTGNTKLDAALQGGTAIDVFMSYAIPRLSQRIKAGAVEDLTPYINQDASIKDWVGSATGLFVLDDKYYCLSTVREPAGVVINKTALEAAGLKVPEKWTIDEFHEMAKQLSNADQTVYGSYIPPDIARIKLGSNYYYKQDGKESNFDDPAWKQFMDLWVQMNQEGSAFPWSEVLAQNLRVYQQNIFLNGQVVLLPSTQFVLRYVNDLTKFPHDFVTTFAPLPTLPDVTDGFNTGSINNYISINAKSQVKDAAWQFIQFRLTEGAKYMLKSAKAPAFPGTDADSIVNGIPGPDKEKLYDVEAYRRVFVDPNYRLVNDTVTTGIAEIQQIVQQQSDRALIDEISVDEWVTTTKTQADDAIKRAGG